MRVVRLFLVSSFFLATFTYAGGNPFDAVFAIMNQDRGPDSMGCVGCHIGREPVPDQHYFGFTQDEVETYLRTDDDGAHVEGGRNSPIARRLRQEGDPAPMPMFGAPWSATELESLYIWLDSITPP